MKRKMSRKRKLQSSCELHDDAFGVQLMVVLRSSRKTTNQYPSRIKAGKRESRELFIPI